MHPSRKYGPGRAHTHTPTCQSRHGHTGSACNHLTSLLLSVIPAPLSLKDFGNTARPDPQKSHSGTGIRPEAIAQPSMMTNPKLSLKPGTNQVPTTDVVKRPKTQTCGKTSPPPQTSPLRPSPGRLSQLPTVSSNPSSKTTSTICQIPTRGYRHVPRHSTTESDLPPPHGHGTGAGCHEKAPER